MGKRARQSPADPGDVAKHGKRAGTGAESCNSLPGTADTSPGLHVGHVGAATMAADVGAASIVANNGVASAADGTAAMADIVPVLECSDVEDRSEQQRFSQHCELLLNAIPDTQSILGWFPSAVENSHSYVKRIRQKVRNIGGVPGCPCYLPLQILAFDDSASQVTVRE